jgi:membrane protease YdiL (CAAX protease family)
MTDNPNPKIFNVRTPVFQLFMSLLIILVTGTLLFTVFIFTGSHIFKIEPDVLGNAGHVPELSEILFIKYTIIVQDLSFFIFPAFLILWKINPGYKVPLFSFRNLDVQDIVLVLILAACAFPVTSIAGEWNSKMVLPHWLAGVEEWMRSKEDDADDLLTAIMSPSTVVGMYVNIFIIAALPAVSEELIFRGIFQKILSNILRSGHLAVWIAAFVFSAVHFQFYGFIPRFILGILYGYLFLWSRSLWLPILAHFVNNAVPVAGAYYKGWKAISETPSTGQADSLPLALLSLAVMIIILAWYRKRSNMQSEKETPFNGQTGEDYY